MEASTLEEILQSKLTLSQANSIGVLSQRGELCVCQVDIIFIDLFLRLIIRCRLFFILIFFYTFLTTLLSQACDTLLYSLTFDHLECDDHIQQIEQESNS